MGVAVVVVTGASVVVVTTGALELCALDPDEEPPQSELQAPGPASMIAETAAASEADGLFISNENDLS